MKVAVTWLGHSTVVLQVGGARLLTDPLLRRHAGPLRRRGPRPTPASWQATDAVLLSHLHHDHAELRSLRMLGPDLPILASHAVADWLTRRGLHGVAVEQDRWTALDGGVEVRLVRADHAARPMPHRPNDAHGHLIRSSAGVVWVAGDTALYEDMAQIPTIAAAPVDLAVVPIGGWGPRLSGGHLDPREAARACRLVGARFALPVHWGTLYAPGMSGVPQGWMDRPGPDFLAALEDLAPSCTGILLEQGESTEIPARPTEAPP